MTDKKINEAENPKDLQQDPQEDASGEGEFKVTVRKLEMPVRPRGVLAE